MGRLRKPNTENTIEEKPLTILTDEEYDNIPDPVKKTRQTKSTEKKKDGDMNLKMMKIKLMGLQIVRKYKATKKRWQDPKYQTESDYLLCKEFEELCTQ